MHERSLLHHQGSRRFPLVPPMTLSSPQVQGMSDAEDRRRAETVFDRNVIVVAGAGTGKTTLLVNRLIHLLMREPHPLTITQVVALTFTNKAATEMKARLRERLHDLIRAGASEPAEAAGAGLPTARPTGGGAVTIEDLSACYGLSYATVAERAAIALRDVEKAQIGTVHSFAAHLLRLHPIESGLDPAFQEDDGAQFDAQFAQAWERWLAQELNEQGTRHPLWRRVLAKTSLADLESLARALCSDLVELDVVQAQLEAECAWSASGGAQAAAGGVHAARCAELSTSLAELAARGAALAAAHQRPKPRKLERMLAAAVTVLTTIAQDGPRSSDAWSLEIRDELAKTPGELKDWSDNDYCEAEQIIRIASQSIEFGGLYLKDLLNVLMPLVRAVRTAMTRTGWVSFDGLLANARALLRDCPAVRERLKQEYRAILVDEFQDTDPLQYEVILSLSEELGHSAASWQDMVLDPGKLCIVGDPKQSIYAFRRADIEAFDRVVEKIEQGGGLRCTLTTNFRSDLSVLRPINEFFDAAFEPRVRVQPANVRLEAAPQRRPTRPSSGVAFHLIVPDQTDRSEQAGQASQSDEEDPDDGAEPSSDRFNAEDGARAEAESLARWIAEERASTPGLSLGDIALLFRKLTQADVYLDALRRYGLAYTIDGEKHFYRRQEVIDLVNVLSLLVNPHDRLALVAVLRAPLGAFTDRDVEAILRAEQTDYRQSARHARWPHPLAERLMRLYALLADLHREIAALPLPEVIPHVLARLPLRELAARTRHGEQALANVQKLTRLAAALADRPEVSLVGLVALLRSRIDDPPEEAEHPLTEEGADAIHVMTVHKAKGLEFPVVVLPGLHQGSRGSQRPPLVVYDWSSGRYGLSLGSHRTLAAILIHEALAVREEAERLRVLYVGMTRARDRLVLTASHTKTRAGDSALRLFDRIAGGKIGESDATSLAIGSSAIPLSIVTAPGRRRSSAERDPRQIPLLPDIPAQLAVWRTRTEVWEQARSQALHRTPSQLTSAHQSPEPSRENRPRGSQPRSMAMVIGTIAHELLYRWDFHGDPQAQLAHIPALLSRRADGQAQDARAEIAESLHAIMDTFLRSEPYRRIQSAEILGRELPLLMPWRAARTGERPAAPTTGDETQIMEGAIDLVYRLNGKVWVADYKTDVLDAETGAATSLQIERYRPQVEVYRDAVARALGQESVGMELIFLRSGWSKRWE